jgi:hypothetical protein
VKNRDVGKECSALPYREVLVYLPNGRQDKVFLPENISQTIIGATGRKTRVEDRGWRIDDI